MDWDENKRPAPWQNEDCLMGTWHYQRDHGYRSAESVIHELVDIVSKNGNLLLNVPLPGNGAIDDAAVSVLEDIGRWLDINGEAIYGSRPWKQFGEEQIRFTTKPGAIYASTLGVSTAEVKIKSLAGEKIARVQLLGSNQKIEWQQTADALVIKPVSDWPCPHAVAFKIDLIQ
jgi:alpha-L-fucosidase